MQRIRRKDRSPNSPRARKAQVTGWGPYSNRDIGSLPILFGKLDVGNCGPLDGGPFGHETQFFRGPP